MTKELQNSLKESEMNAFIIYYALSKYASQFTKKPTYQNLQMDLKFFWKNMRRKLLRF